VADFFCPICNNEYELKSKNGALSSKINDGAYSTMIERITSNRNPDFFFMSYSRSDLKVNDFLFVPKHFFVPEIIEKRNPLAQTARRAGWTGCNILIDKIPTQGRISIVSAGCICNSDIVLQKVKASAKLEVADINSRGWLMDVLHCVNAISDDIFTLSMVYAYENELAAKHPNNNNIRAKIRQQLQQLRDRGIISFLGNGLYQKKQ
jgi:type II restriction enzyme